MAEPGSLPSAGDPQLGMEYEVTLGHIVPGGYVLAFIEGRTIFVRHGIPGERVRICVREVHKRFVRADVVAILQASEYRVEPPCRYAGECGGCDFQHIDLAHQRELKSDMLNDALRRQGGIERVVPVEQVPGAPDGLHWRTRVRWQTDSKGNRGFYRYRSHDVVAVDECLTMAPGAQDGDGPFSQVHVGISELLQHVVIDWANPREGEHWWDLFGGAGLFAQALAQRGAAVDVVDSSADAISALDRRRLAGVRGWHSSVRDWLPTQGDVDGIVADPPRAGIGAELIGSLATRRARMIIMVSCHPVTLARDLAALHANGYQLTAMRAFDAFPMTKHIEVIAALVPQRQRID